MPIAWCKVGLVNLLVALSFAVSVQAFSHTDVGVKVSYPVLWPWGYELFASTTLFSGTAWELGFFPQPLQLGEVVAFSNLELVSSTLEIIHLPWRLTTAMGVTVRWGAPQRFYKSTSSWHMGPQFRVGMEVLTDPLVFSGAGGLRWIEQLTLPRRPFFELGVRAHW